MKMPVVIAFVLLALLPCLCVMLQSSSQPITADANEVEDFVFCSQTVGDIDDPPAIPVDAAAAQPEKEAKRRRILLSMVSILRPTNLTVTSIRKFKCRTWKIGRKRHMQ